MEHNTYSNSRTDEVYGNCRHCQQPQHVHVGLGWKCPATNLAPVSNDDQRPAQVARRIEYALANGVELDDGNVIDYLADNMTRATLPELRTALARTIYASRFPKACQPRPAGVRS